MRSFRGDEPEPAAKLHLEVKSTVRPEQSRFPFVLSRHEFEVGARDDAWHLALVARWAGAWPRYVEHDVVAAMAPADGVARWTAARFELDHGVAAARPAGRRGR